VDLNFAVLINGTHSQFTLAKMVGTTRGRGGRPWLGISGQQKERPRKPFFNGVEQLVQQALINLNTPCQEVVYETVGACAFNMQNTSHLMLVDYYYLVGVIATAASFRSRSPDKHFSPKKSPAPKSAPTASFPSVLTTESFTPPP
jgi:hypothetical protein